MLLRAATHLVFENADVVPMVLMLRPRSGDGQWIKAESYDVTPATDVTEYTDLYGNLCQRITGGPGELTIDATCEAEVPDFIDYGPGVAPTPIEELPGDLLQFLLPSRYCESDKLLDQAKEVVQGCAPGYDQAETIRCWVQSTVAYAPGASDSSTSAFDTLGARQGVCRDQAHLGIALCRALDLPARMVVGYLHGLEPMDLHAWFECYIGGRWWTFDAKEPTTEAGRVVIGYGRDAADVALATQFGPAELKTLSVTVERL